MESLWQDVDDYIADRLIAADPALEAVLAANRAANLPAIDVAPNQGKLLQLIARIAGAKRILEIGTLGGYSTIWLAGALPAEGRLVTLERDPHHAAVARDNIVRAGFGAIVALIEGNAVDSLQSLADTGEPAFDLVFIDADKPSNPDYLRWAIRLSRPGSLIIVDNVVRGGKLIDAGSDDAAVRGTRTLLDLVGGDARLDATAIQTVGSKGHDGLLIARVR